MLHVHKWSSAPLQLWAAHRAAGVNNFCPDVRSLYLILWNIEMVRKDDLWHYILDFETRDSLEIYDPTQSRAAGRYPDGTDWKTWLGTDWERITEAQRWQILQQPANRKPGDVKITNMRTGPGALPRNH